MIKATTRQKYMSSNSKLHVLTGQELTPELLMLCSGSLSHRRFLVFIRASTPKGQPTLPCESRQTQRTQCPSKATQQQVLGDRKGLTQS